MKKMYKISYEVTGGRRIDYMTFFAKSISDAIAEFVATEIECLGFKWTMTEHSIVSVECIG